YASSVNYTVTLKNLDITSSSSQYELIYFEGDSQTSPTLIGTNLTIHDFSGDSYGGLVLKYNAVANLTGCTFENLTGYTYGGAIYTDSECSLTLTGCTFTGNVGGGGGGAVYLNNETTGTFTDCTFTNNSDNNYGGAIQVDGSTATITGCTFTGNTAGNGGAISVEYQSNVTVTDCTITGNSVDSYGGAIFMITNTETATLTLDGTTTVSGNSAAGGPNPHGGGIAAYYNFAPSGAFVVNGAGTRVTGNTPTPQCVFTTDSGTTWTEAVNCTF
ncbi:MAG: right-handed parallel beta-helix repeat-containing protein, partial [Chloroflexota bacterium]